MQTFERVYLGIAEGNWKQRLYNYRQPFKDKKHKNDTTLSNYLWNFKEVSFIPSRETKYQ